MGSADGEPYRHLSNAYGKNHFEVDKPFQSILGHFTGKVPDLSSLGSFAGIELYEVADYVDKTGAPKLITWSIGGERVDEVWLDPSERRVLQRLMTEFGVNKPPYRGGTWFDHYASIYLISDPGIACILTVTNQTAYALHKYGNQEQKKLIPALIGESGVSYGATWFTETQGGSDLGANLVESQQEGGGLEDKWGHEVLREQRRPRRPRAGERKAERREGRGEGAGAVPGPQIRFGWEEELHCKKAERQERDGQRPHGRGGVPPRGGPAGG